MRKISNFVAVIKKQGILLLYIIGMLQQFTVDNFLSFKDSVTLNLKPGRGSRLKTHKAEFIKEIRNLDVRYVFLEMPVQEECYGGHSWEKEVENIKNDRFLQNVHYLAL